MEGAYPTIQLPCFHGEGSDDTEKHLFICENILAVKHITNEDTKLVQLAIRFKDCTLDWYMGLVVNIPLGAPTIVKDVKKELINEFQRLSSEDKYMNEMIEIKQNLWDSIWEVYQKFKRLKGKLKYPINGREGRVGGRDGEIEREREMEIGGGRKRERWGGGKEGGDWEGEREREGGERGTNKGGDTHTHIYTHTHTHTERGGGEGESEIWRGLREREREREIYINLLFTLSY
jgi:hypothetical protein